MEAAEDARAIEVPGVGSIPREVLDNPGLYLVAGAAVLAYNNRAKIGGFLKKLFKRG